MRASGSAADRPTTRCWFSRAPIIARSPRSRCSATSSWSAREAGGSPRRGMFRCARIWPLFTLSIPLAWLGGRIAVAERTVHRPARGQPVRRRAGDDLPAATRRRAALASNRAGPSRSIGGGLGFLAGIVGIGGGIFLAPILYLMRWGRAKVIAGTCAVFILVNSIAGLFGQCSRPTASTGSAVVGDRIGRCSPRSLHRRDDRREHLAAARCARTMPRYATAILMLYVAARLALRCLGLASGSG